MLGERFTLLLSLLSQSEYRTLEDLSSQMDLSTKTVRNLLRELDEKLEHHGAQIKNERGKGYLLEVDDLSLFQTFFLSDTQKVPADQQGRVLYIIERFLKESEYIKMDSLCEQLYVSRKTLSADIKQAEAFFNKYHLTLERKPHYGMRLAGDEFQKRHCLSGFLQIKDPVSFGSALAGNNLEIQIAQCLIDLLENEDYHVTDVGLDNLILHISIAVQRIRSGHYIFLPESESQKWSAGTNYELAKRCVSKLSEVLGITFPEEEIRYLAIHFAGKETSRNFVIDSGIQETAREMLEEIYQVFQIDFRSDLELLMELSAHLVPLVIRLKYGMRLNNPILTEVRSRYSFAYIVAVEASAVLERKYSCVLDSNEEAYLATILQLALERRRTSIEKKNVLLVCSSGAGTARLMAYQMKSAFGNYISAITTCDQRSIGKQDFSKIDYVFTTVPVDVFVPVPICEVENPFDAKGRPVVRGFLSGSVQKDILSYYPETLFFPHLHATNKQEALQEIFEHITAVRPLPKGFYEALLERESLARTCMGNHVAMPHPAQVMTDDTFVSVGLLDKPIRWDEDNEVQAIFLVSVSRQKNKKLNDFYSTTARLLLDRSKINLILERRDYQTLAECLRNTDIERNT